MKFRANKKRYLIILGYVLMGISAVTWIGGVVAPFVLKKNLAIAVTPTLIIIGEVTFYFSIILLGKEIWQKIKSFFSFKKKEKSTEDIDSE